MICPDCNSKLTVKYSREDGFTQIRLRECQRSDCDFKTLTLEKPYQNEFETEKTEVES